MRRTTLGRTGIEVSAVCLGTMTWGTQNTEEDGHAQIRAALDRGIDFLDTAEAYPVNPMTAEGAGRTEEIIGTWIAANGRDDLVIATKIAGGGGAVRPDGISATSIREACEGSLRRLKTDVIDLYQFHWPNRGSYHFRQNWTFDPSKQDTDVVAQDMADCMGALQMLVDEGLIRAFGLSNESAWGTMRWLDLAEKGAGPRVAAMQNEYSLLCRLYDTDMAELSHHEDVTLLAFSPLGAGYLSGQYADGAVPEGSRKSINEKMGGRETPRVQPATDAYVALAKRHGIHPVTMANAWVLSRPFPAIPIFGGRSLEQIAPAFDAGETTLPDDLLDEIDAIHKAHPMPY